MSARASNRSVASSHSTAPSDFGRWLSRFGDPWNWAEVVWFADANHARARFREPDKYSEAVFEFMEKNGFGRLPQNGTSSASKKGGQAPV